MAPGTRPSRVRGGRVADRGRLPSSWLKMAVGTRAATSTDAARKLQRAGIRLPPQRAAILPHDVAAATSSAPQPTSTAVP